MRRPAGYSARARMQRTSKSKKDRIGYMIFAASGLVVAAVVALALPSHAKVDPKTGCLLDHKPPVAHTIVLIDETDQLSRDELKYAKELILNEYHWLPIGGRLTVRNIVADPDAAEDIVVCRMSDGSNALGIVNNPKMLRKAFDKVAGARLEELYTALRTAQPQEYSPIMEFISAVMDRGNFSGNIKDRRLVILSDMAQHSALFSQYGHAHAQPGRQVNDELRRDMSGVEVRVHYVARHKLAAMQGKPHQRFWINYLQGMGAKVAVGHTLLVGEDPGRETWTE